MIVAGPEVLARPVTVNSTSARPNSRPADDFGMMRECWSDASSGSSPRRRGRPPSPFREGRPQPLRLGVLPAGRERTGAGGGRARRAALAGPGFDRRRARPALGGARGARRARRRSSAGRHRQGAGSRRRPRNLLCARPRLIQATAARSGAVFRRAVARRSASLRRRLARARRSRNLRESGLQEIAGIGPAASARCCTTSARSRRSSVRRLPI